MKYETLTVKVLPEVMADLDAYAAQEFPIDCRKCGGHGAFDDDSVCTKCNGNGIEGNRSEAVRFLLQYGLGDKATPEARAMMAIYTNVAPRVVQAVNSTAHETVKMLKSVILEAIEEAGFNQP